MKALSAAVIALSGSIAFSVGSLGNNDPSILSMWLGGVVWGVGVLFWVKLAGIDRGALADET